MSLAHLIKYARTLAPGTAAALGWRWLGRNVTARLGMSRDRNRSTYEPARVDGPPVLGSYVPEISAETLAPAADILAAYSGRYLDHRFDLLGSGWVRVEHAMTCAGFAGHGYASPLESADGRRDRLLGRLSPGNRERARKIWELAGPGYRPIDWHLDFRSGYRWSEADWHGTIAYGHEPGVDVKVPWELARLQHLPQLALAHILAQAGTAGFEAPEIYCDAFRDQVADFLAANPPRFGVNWASTMDVAIRAANLLLALDLFRRHGARFEDGFVAEVEAAARAHGRHIAAHLDWHRRWRGNHYLTSITGLLFVAAYLERTVESDCWLAIAVRQLVVEVERQFTPDGACFEASTGYHRLSAEAVAYATALVLGLPDNRKAALAGYDHRPWRGRPPLPAAPLPLYPLPGAMSGDATSPFPPWYFERLAGMARFTRHVTKPNGRVVQIGDADNGRFLKLVPACVRTTGEDGPVDDPLDHHHLIAAIDRLFGGEDFAAGNSGAVEAAMIRGLAGGFMVAGGGTLEDPALSATNGGVNPTVVWEREIVIDLPDGSVLDGLRACAYPDFGLYIWRSARLFLALRCGAADHDGVGAHAHNDQLALELNIDGTDWVADPGSYVYTAAPDLRNAYRSVMAHAAPRRGSQEPGRLDGGPFRLEDTARARCLRFDDKGFHGVHRGFGTPVHRTIAIAGGRIIVTDGTETTAAAAGTAECQRIVVRDPQELRDAFALALPFCPGYGRQAPPG
jgi:hypothetical protein